MVTFTTYNHIPIPPFLYGTAWKKEATAHVVQLAVRAGFTGIDTANQLIHYDEALVGEALRSLTDQGITRETVFLQTKFTPVDGHDHRIPYDPSADIPTQVKQSFDSSLQHLHTEYIDSYILHGPYSRRGLGKRDWEVWITLEDLYQSGKAKMIGISNVQADQLQCLCDKANIKPMVVQNRCYAVRGWDQDVRAVCREHHIIYQGFSLLTANQQVVEDPAIGTIATRLGTGPAQVIFRFAMQLGILPLTGTTSEQHMQEDLQAQNITLSQDDMHNIERIMLA